MPEPQSPGGVEWHRFDQLNPELNYGTQHTGMCWAAPRFYSPNNLQTPQKARVGLLLRQCCLNEPVYFLTLHQSVINTLNFALVCNREWYILLYSNWELECFLWHSLGPTLQGLLGISTVTSSGYYMLLYNYCIKSMLPSWLHWLLRCICILAIAKHALQRWVVDGVVCCGATLSAGDLCLVRWQTS